jgi:siroheme synthase
VGAGERPNDWARTAAFADTAVIYMGAGEAQMITSALLREGLPETTPVVIVENASLPDFRRFSLVLRDLPRVADLGLSGPSTIMLGAVYADVAAAASEATDLEAARPEGERLAAFRT